REYGKYDLPSNVAVDIQDYISRFGRLKLIKFEEQLLLTSDDRALITEIANNKRIQPYILGWAHANALRVDPAKRGHIKQALVVIGYPAEDLAGYVQGAALEIHLRPMT